MKNSVTRFALLSVVVIGTGFAAQAQNDAPPAAPPVQTQTRGPVDPQKTLDHLRKKLALSADQQNQILPILTDRQQQVAAIESDTTLDQKQRHAKMKAVRSDSESKLRNILTDTQRAAYDEMQQQARDRAKARRQGNVS